MANPFWEDLLQHSIKNGRKGHYWKVTNNILKTFICPIPHN